MLLTVLTTIVLSFLLTLIFGFLLIPLLHRLKFGQQIREDGPKRHQNKAGIPTMGGIMILGALVLSTVLIGPRDVDLFWALGITLGFGFIGFCDDLIIILAGRTLGLRARHKLIFQILFAAAFALHALNRVGSRFLLPYTLLEVDLGFLYLPFAVIVVIGASNAVNLTDGLDGLAAGTTVIAAAAYLIITLIFEQTSLVVFSAAIIGSCMGFIWFNSHPAQVFMGDIGSLALGAALAALAILTRTELFLVIIGGVFVLETLSVILQVIYFRLTGGRRLFLMSPLHHHFELKGWPEPKVVTRFWILAIVFSLLGLLGLR